MPAITVPTPPPLVNIHNVELIHTGEWNISTGTWTATREDLASAVAALDCPAVRNPVIKIGHTDPRFDGEPAVGWIGNLATARDGDTLTGSYMGVPGWLAAVDDAGNSVLASAYPDRSIEGVHDFRCQIGHTHPFVLTAVALLGVTPPGVGTLQSLQDIAALYGVAAAAVSPTGTSVTVTVHAKQEAPVPNPRPTQVAAGVTTEDVRRQYYDDAPWSYWICEFHLEPLQLIVIDDDSGKHYRVPVTVTGEDTFTFGDPVEVLVRYVDTSTNSQVAASASPIVYASRAESRPGQPSKAAASQPATTDPPTPPPADPPAAPSTPPDPGGVAVSPAAEPDPIESKEERVSDDIRSLLGVPDDADDDAIKAAIEDLKTKATQPAEPAEPQVQPDREAELVAASNAALAEVKAELGRVSAQLAERNQREAAATKKALFDSAVNAGKIRPADREPWETRYDRAPEVTAEILDALAPGTAVPVAASGEVGGDIDAFVPDALIAEVDSIFTVKPKGA